MTTINAYAIRRPGGTAEPFADQRSPGPNDGYQQAACLACEFCRDGHEQLCPEQKDIDVDCHGGAGRAHRRRQPVRVPDSAGARVGQGGSAVVGRPHRLFGHHQGGPARRFGRGRTRDCGLGCLAVQFLREMGHRVSALCVVAQPLEMLSISLGLLYDGALRSIYGNHVGSRRDMMAMLAFAAVARIVLQR